MVKDKTKELVYREKQIAMGNKTLYKWVPARYHKMLSEILSNEEDIEDIIINHLAKKRKFYDDKLEALSAKMEPRADVEVPVYPTVEIMSLKDPRNREKMRLRIKQLIDLGSSTNIEIASQLNLDGFRSWNNKAGKDCLISPAAVSKITRVS